MLFTSSVLLELHFLIAPIFQSHIEWDVVGWRMKLAERIGRLFPLGCSILVLIEIFRCCEYGLLLSDPELDVVADVLQHFILFLCEALICLCAVVYHSLSQLACDSGQHDCLCMVLAVLDQEYCVVERDLEASRVARAQESHCELEGLKV